MRGTRVVYIIWSTQFSSLYGSTQCEYGSFLYNVKELNTPESAMRLEYLGDLKLTSIKSNTALN